MVIAIIAILAAILFPVFAKAREKARQSSCSSNLKQIALSNLQYVQDYDEVSQMPTLPGTNWTRGGTCSGCFIQYEAGMPDARAGVRWEPLGAYTKNSQLWYCPSARSWQSYGWGRGGENRSMADILLPSQQVMYGDSRRVGNGGASVGTSPWLTRGSIASGCCASRGAANEAANPHRVGDIHNDGANLAFWDGHVKWTKAVALRPDTQTSYGIQFEITNRTP